MFSSMNNFNLKSHLIHRYYLKEEQIEYHVSAFVSVLQTQYGEAVLDSWKHCPLLEKFLEVNNLQKKGYLESST
jgi:hypothetical protein